LRRFDQLLSGTVEQPAIGRVGDGFGLHGRVQYDRLQALALDDATRLGGLDALRQQPFATLFADALPP
jgi:hypothetical protein